MSEDQANRARIFRTELEDFIRKDLTEDAALTAVRIVEQVEKAYQRDLAELATKARVLDDLVSLAKIPQVSPDIRPDEMWQKVMNLLKQEKLL